MVPRANFGVHGMIDQYLVYYRESNTIHTVPINSIS